MTAAAMSAFEARAGSALIRKLANASGDFGGGLVVEGIFDDAIANDLGMLARDPTFDVFEADLDGRALCRGDTVAITCSGELTAYLLRGEPVKDTHQGTLTLALEKDLQT